MTVARDLFLAVALLGVTILAHDIGLEEGVKSVMAESTLALGFLLLFAFLLGRMALLFQAPMITGFLVAGVMVGPFGLDIVTNEAAAPLRLVDDIALALIAFSAGGELNIGRFMPRIKALLWTAGAQSVFTLAFVFAAFVPLMFISGLVDRTLSMAFSAALLLGVIATANSPATAIAVITETRSKGPVSDTILGVTVFKDVMVIVLFGLSMGLVSAILGEGESLGWSFAWHVIYDMGLSLALGGVIGALIIAYLKADYGNIPLFVLGVALAMVEVCAALELRPLLAAITAGFVVENFSKEGQRLIEGLETSSLPIFIVFFSLAGQGLDLNALSVTWPYATMLVVTRMIGTRMGVFKGLKMAGESEQVARYAWTGFIGQAGVSIGFAVLIGKQFPGWGEQLSTLIVASIVINQMIGPVMMKRSLTQSGEAKAELDEGDGKPLKSTSNHERT